MARNKYPEVTVKRIIDTSFRLFMEKGYEQTTIQDIIDALGDLSKGAIYHHFKSKEDIMLAVSKSMDEDFYRRIGEIRSSKALNGLQKIQEMALSSLRNPMQTDLLTAVPDILKNPHFLAEQIYSGNEVGAPILQEFIELGIADGSITATHPRPLSQILILLMNVWLNPMVFSCTNEAFLEKFSYLQELTTQLGIPLLDHEMMERLESYRRLGKEPATTP